MKKTWKWREGPKSQDFDYEKWWNPATTKELITQNDLYGGTEANEIGFKNGAKITL